MSARGIITGLAGVASGISKGRTIAHDRAQAERDKEIERHRQEFRDELAQRPLRR
jgi:hypothetical protein